MTVLVDRPVAAEPTINRSESLQANGHGMSSRGDSSSFWRRLKPDANEGTIVCAASFLLYLVAAMLLAFKYQLYPDDAVSRLANGFYVLYSRDPHLAAMGFVWNPLQSICDLVPLLFKSLWHALATRDVAGSLVSVVCMTGAVHQLRASLAEWGVWRGPRLVLTAIFAVSPMMVYFGANGMSEALYLFTLLATTRYLLRWQRTDDLRSLVYAATALGLAYLARNEAVAAAAISGILVLAVSFMRSNASLRSRVTSALTDTTIFLMPFIVTFVGWATTSFVITGQAFPQAAGNSIQVKTSGFSAGSLGTRLLHEVSALESLAPLLPLVLGVALAVAWRRRDHAVLIPLAVLGGGLAFDLVAYDGGSLFPWLRYYILVIPIDVLVLGSLLTTSQSTMMIKQLAGGHGNRQVRRATIAAMGISLIALVPSLPTSAIAMVSPTLGQGETLEYLGPIFHVHLTALDRAAKKNYSHIQAIDAYLERMNLPDGDLIVDNIDTCLPNLIVNSSNPRIFVIPNDRDFQKVLSAPLTFGTHYILVSVPSGIDAQDAILAAYPNIYNSGDGFSTEVHQFAGGGLCPAFRLFRVTGQPPGVRGF